MPDESNGPQGSIAKSLRYAQEQYGDADSQSFQYVQGGEFFLVDPPPPSITIQGENGHPLVTIHPNGTLEYGEGYDPDEAARRFWEAMRTHMLVPTRHALGLDQGNVEDRIATARALHIPVEHRTGWTDGDYDSIAPACSACGSEDNAVRWPCPTIQALDGEAQ